jgi:formate dehydrogenase assembly factor FdhD
VGVLAAVSAATALAAHTAEELGVALAGFVRMAAAVAYSHAERLTLTPRTTIP